MFLCLETKTRLDLSQRTRPPHSSILTAKLLPFHGAVARAGCEGAVKTPTMTGGSGIRTHILTPNAAKVSNLVGIFSYRA